MLVGGETWRWHLRKFPRGGFFFPVEEEARSSAVSGSAGGGVGRLRREENVKERNRGCGKVPGSVCRMSRKGGLSARPCDFLPSVQVQAPSLWTADPNQSGVWEVREGFLEEVDRMN